MNMFLLVPEVMTRPSARKHLRTFQTQLDIWTAKRDQGEESTAPHPRSRLLPLLPTGFVTKGRNKTKKCS
jgi:hypothetical protein